MTRLLIALSPQEVRALDRLMAGQDGFLPGIGRHRARVVGPPLLRGVELAADNDRLREEVEQLRQAERTLHADLAHEPRARGEAEAARDRTLKALKAERDGHVRTGRRLRNARAAAARLRASRDAMRRVAPSVPVADHAATD